MPKLTELTATSTLANADILVVTTNTSGTAVSNSLSINTLSSAVSVGGSAFPGHVVFTVSANEQEQLTSQEEVLKVQTTRLYFYTKDLLINLMLIQYMGLIQSE